MDLYVYMAEEGKTGNADIHEGQAAESLQGWIFL